MNKHLLNIGLNMIRMFIVPIAIFATSFIVIQTSSKELWGDFVRDFLLINLASMLVQFGSKEQLIRSYSETPKEINHLFFESLTTRGIILIPVLVIFWFVKQDLFTWGLLSICVLGLYLYQSAESLVIYHKKFIIQIVAELFALVSTIAVLVLNKPISVELILIAFALGIWIKTLILLFIIFPKPQAIKFNSKHFLLLTPFFIIGLSGLLQSRVDQYIIASYCKNEIVGIYQLFLSVFILIQSLSAVIIIPYNKHIYRVGISVFTKVQRTISIIGVFVVSFLGITSFFLLPIVFTIDLPPYYYIIGALFAFPSFVYVPIIFLFYRVKREREVMWVNYFGAAINLILTFIFVLKGNPMNAILGSAIGQWAILAWYMYRKKTIVNAIEMS